MRNIDYLQMNAQFVCLCEYTHIWSNFNIKEHSFFTVLACFYNFIKKPPNTFQNVVFTGMIYDLTGYNNI